MGLNPGIAGQARAARSELVPATCGKNGELMC